MGSEGQLGTIPSILVYPNDTEIHVYSDQYDGRILTIPWCIVDTNKIVGSTYRNDFDDV